MGSYNKVLLMGNLTRDVELKYTQGNQAVARIGLAVNRRFKTADGQMKEEVTFVDCDAWGRTAENISKFFSKGRAIFIEGRLRLDTWQDKQDGSNRSKLKVVVDSFEFVDSKQDGGGPRSGGGGGGGGGYVDDAPSGPGPGPGPAPRMQQQRQPAGPAQPQDSYEPIQEDDIPF